METICNSNERTSTALDQVWAFELNDIDERLSGKDPDSGETMLRGLGEKIKGKTGIDVSSQLAAVSLVPGGTLATLVGGFAAGALDSIRSYELHGYANATQKLLAVRSCGVQGLNWDTANDLLVHARDWLLPRLQTRLALLSQVLSASGGNNLVSERVVLYKAAIAEVEQIALQLKGQVDGFEREWESRKLRYESEVAEVRDTYERAKTNVSISADALLIDRATAREKLLEIEKSFSHLKCSHKSGLSGCENLEWAPSSFCLYHTCFQDGCLNEVRGKGHYCIEHSSQLSEVEAHLPKMESELGISQAMKKSMAESGSRLGGAASKKSSGLGWVVKLLFALAFLIFLFFLFIYLSIFFA